MKNNTNPFKKMAIFSVAVFLVSLLILSIPAVAKKSWNGIVHAPLKRARSFDWSAPDEFFTGKERGKIKYTHSSDRFVEMGTSVIFSYLVNGKEDVLKERKKGTSYNPLSSRNR